MCAGPKSHQRPIGPYFCRTQTLGILHCDENINEGNDVYGVLTVSPALFQGRVCSIAFDSHKLYTAGPVTFSRDRPEAETLNLLFAQLSSAVDLSFLFLVDSLNFLRGFAMPSKA